MIPIQERVLVTLVSEPVLPSDLQPLIVAPST